MSCLPMIVSKRRLLTYCLTGPNLPPSQQRTSSWIMCEKASKGLGETQYHCGYIEYTHDEDMCRGRGDEIKYICFCTQYAKNPTC